MNELECVIVRPVEGFEGLYEINSDGDVISLNWRHIPGKKHVIKPFIRNKKGYQAINLYKDGVKFMFHVHYLVVRAFPDICGDWFDGAVINHKDEQVWNNKASNLEVCTVAYNNSYGTARQRTRETNVANGHWCVFEPSSPEYREYWNGRARDHRANMSSEEKDHYREMAKAWNQKWYDSLTEEQKQAIKDRRREYYKRTYVPHPRQKVKTADIAAYRREYYRKQHPEVKTNRPVERTGNVMDIFLCRYDCLKDAAKAMGATDVSLISKAARGVKPKAYGYRWRYVDEKAG